MLKLLELSNNSDFIIVIFSNQKGLNKFKLSVKDFEDKIDNIKKLLETYEPNHITLENNLFWSKI